MLSNSATELQAVQTPPPSAVDPPESAASLGPDRGAMRSAAPRQKSEFERELEATISENPLTGWMLDHPVVYHATAAGITLAVVIVAYAVARWIFIVPLLRLLQRRDAASSRRVHLVRAINNAKLVGPLSWVLPFLIGWRGIYLWPGLTPWVAEAFGRTMLGIAIAIGVLAFGRGLVAVDLLVSERLRRPEALRGYVQAISAAVGVIAAITVIAILLGRSPLYFLTGVGAFTAILAVILRDTFLSMYANILMTMGDMLRVGDWIEIKPLSVDGRVESIRLTSTRVRNWDETTVTVPNHRFVSDVFVNYRTQNAKGGRRFRRSLRIDLRSVRVLSSDEIIIAAREPSIGPAVTMAQESARLAAFDGASVITNLTLYRAYVERFIATHPLVDRGRPIVVRQNEPSIAGASLDVLCFFFDSEVRDYESLQASILDHLVTATQVFGLRIFQQGSDLAVVREPFPFLAPDDLRQLAADAAPDGSEIGQAWNEPAPART